MRLSSTTRPYWTKSQETKAVISVVASWIASLEISDFSRKTSVVRCAIWYYLYNLKNVENTHGEVLILVQLQTKIAKRITSVLVFFFR